MSESIDLLLSRRSVKARKLTEPGPDAKQLETILQASARVPDHGKLCPWRFIVLKGEARAKFSEIVVAAYKRRKPEARDEKIEKQRRRFQQAPAIVVVVSCTTPHAKVAKWEQKLSIGAACMNMLHAVHALDFAAQWLTDWQASDPAVAEALGLDGDQYIAGFIHIGSAMSAPKDRPRPELSDIVTEWQPPA